MEIKNGENTIMKKISFIIPSRNNLPFLQQAYYSIRDNIGSEHEIVMLDDASEDGTWKWLESLDDENIIIHQNKGPERLGHTILYDTGVELSTSEIFSIFHADMIASPNYVKNLVKHLERGSVIASTRIEPPLHPPGPEKIVKDFGMGVDEFQKAEFLEFVKATETEFASKITPGIFAPWAMYKEDFQAIGGHDPLFAPMELEDSDIFNRMLLAGYKIQQSRDSFVYHMTCRGSRFKDGIEIEKVIDLPDGTKWHKPKDSEEYTKLRNIKFREWWRKWNQNVLHDELMMPIVIPKYNIGIILHNGNEKILYYLEPWCDRIYTDVNIDDYIAFEQPKTKFDLSKRCYNLEQESSDNIIVNIDGTTFGQDDYMNMQSLSQIIQDSGSIGTFKLGSLHITVNSLETFEKNLIKCITD